MPEFGHRFGRKPPIQKPLPPDDVPRFTPDDVQYLKARGLAATPHMPLMKEMPFEVPEKLETDRLKTAIAFCEDELSVTRLRSALLLCALVPSLVLNAFLILYSL
jgi:hypothetical protein